VSARAEFLGALRAALRGVPPAAIDEIVAEYGSHFDEGLAANRSEAEVAAALGSPLTLADELRVELRIANWEAAPSPRSALQVVGSVIALGIMSSVLLFVAGPLVLLAAVIVLVGIVSLAGGGVWMLFAGASLELPGGAVVAVLGSVGLIAAAVALAASAALLTWLIVGGLARYARLHYRLLPRVPRPGQP